MRRGARNSRTKKFLKIEKGTKILDQFAPLCACINRKENPKNISHFLDLVVQGQLLFYLLLGYGVRKSLARPWAKVVVFSKARGL